MDDGIGQKEGEGELREGNEGNARWGYLFLCPVCQNRRKEKNGDGGRCLMEEGFVWEAEEQANAEIFLIISKFAKNALKVWNVNRDGKRGSELLEEE